MSVPSPWLSPPHPPLRVILTILRRLRTSLKEVRGRPGDGAAARKRLAKGEAKQVKDEEIFDDPGAAARNWLSRAEGKQAQDNEVVDDEDTITIIDDEDTITIIDDEDTITIIDD
jgi:hypothetical protein